MFFHRNNYFNAETQGRREKLELFVDFHLSWFVLIVTFLLLMLLSGCQLQARAGSSGSVGASPTSGQAAVLPTAVATATSTHTPIPTETAVPSPTAEEPPTLTPQPTDTPTATPTLTPSPTWTPPPISRICPDPAPVKPTYTSYYLDAEVWPTPQTDAAVPHFSFIKPVPGGGRTIINKSYPYGTDGGGRYLIHNGIDISGELGMPVLAVADGTVVVAQSDYGERYGWRCDWYGHLVVLELEETWQGQPIYILYGHILNLAVEPGQRVEQGEPLAEIGLGGAAIVPHLHLEVRVGTNEFGASRNPMLWIDPGPTRGVVAGRLVDPEGRPWQGVTVTLIDGSEDEPEFINTTSYQGDPDRLINPDEELAENFVFADVAPGEYVLYVKLQGVEYRQPITVTAGQITTVEVVTEPYKTPTPTPEVTPTETAVPNEDG